MAVHVFVTSKGYSVCQSKLPQFNYKRPEGALFCLRSGVNTAVALNFVLVSTSG